MIEKFDVEPVQVGLFIYLQKNPHLSRQHGLKKAIKT